MCKRIKFSRMGKFLYLIGVYDWWTFPHFIINSFEIKNHTRNILLPMHFFTVLQLSIIIIFNLKFLVSMYTSRSNVRQYIRNQLLAFLILLYSVYYIDDSPYYIDDIVDLDSYYINDKPFYPDAQKLVNINMILKLLLI